MATRKGNGNGNGNGNGYSLEAVGDTVVRAIEADVAYRLKTDHQYQGTVILPFFRLGGTSWSLWDALADKFPTHFGSSFTRDATKKLLADACSLHPRLTYTLKGKIGLDLGVPTSSRVVRTPGPRPSW